jgi:hypothetical protein
MLSILPEVLPDNGSYSYQAWLFLNESKLLSFWGRAAPERRIWQLPWDTGRLSAVARFVSCQQPT